MSTKEEGTKSALSAQDQSGAPAAAHSRSAASGAAGRTRLPWQTEKKIWGVGFGIFLIVFWEVLSRIVNNSFVLPGPLDVIANLWENRAVIFTVHLPATMEVVLIGGALSIVLGAALAVAMDASKAVERAVYPILTVTQTIPTMCVAPVFVLWLGYTVQMRVLVVVLVNFFSVTVNVFDGLKSTRKERTELLESYGANRLQQFLLLRVPSAAPAFFTSLRVAVPWAVVGAAVAEWLGAQYGLGTYSRHCMMELDAAGLLAPLLVLTVVAQLLNILLGLIESRVIRWKES